MSLSSTDFFHENIYIMGYGRSGSTILETALATSLDMFPGGELKYIPDRGGLLNENCSCGSPAQSCNFWGPFLAKFSQAELKELADITKRLDSSVSFPFNLVCSRLGFLSSEIGRYQKFNRQVLDYLKARGQSRVIDSSKMPARLYFLSWETLPPYQAVIWLVRDCRGVAWSSMKKKRRPEASATANAFMPRFGFLSAILRWALNLFVSFIVYRSLRKKMEVIKYNYESLGQEEIIFENQLYLDNANQNYHSISGNPLRFERARKFSPDLDWEDNLTWQQKKIGAFFSIVLRRLLFS